MNPRFNCPTCNSVNFTYTGETEKCCKLCETKWDDYGNVVHPQPISRSEAYEDIINEESQSNTIMDNQQTQPQAIPSLILSPVQQLNFNIADLNETAMKLEDVIASQERRLMELERELESERRIMELESKHQQNTLTEEAAKQLIEALHDQVMSEVEETFSGEYVDIEIGSYSDSVRLDNIFSFPFIRTPKLSDMGDAFIDAGIKVLNKNNED
jgi:hypothetical protein